MTNQDNELEEAYQLLGKLYVQLNRAQGIIVRQQAQLVQQAGTLSDEPKPKD